MQIHCSGDAVRWGCGVMGMWCGGAAAWWGCGAAGMRW